ncbi:mitochondrial distribution and morphology family 33, partial [Thamnocephalis sphaerospora]
DARAVIEQVGARLNQMTGYDEIAQLKTKVINSEKAFLTSRERLRACKTAYDDAVGARATSQREINKLLQHQQTWDDKDVTRFAEQFRKEQMDEQAERSTKAECAQAEVEVEHRYNQLVDAIRARYHEEQLWSDKIRGASTYGTLALMLINVLLFISVQTIFEPRKREKLGQHVERLLNERSTAESAELRESMSVIQAALAQQQ